MKTNFGTSGPYLWPSGVPDCLYAPHDQGPLQARPPCSPLSGLYARDPVSFVPLSFSWPALPCRSVGADTAVRTRCGRLAGSQPGRLSTGPCSAESQAQSRAACHGFGDRAPCGSSRGAFVLVVTPRRAPAAARRGCASVVPPLHVLPTPLARPALGGPCPVAVLAPRAAVVRVTLAGSWHRSGRPSPALCARMAAGFESDYWIKSTP